MTIRFGLAHRDNWYRQLRIDGQFAYPVPGLSWRHLPVEKAAVVDLRPFADVDALWLDDGKYSSVDIRPARGQRLAPVVYYVLYPTLAEHLFKQRLQIAQANADLVLLDHDRVDRWAGHGFEVRRLAYSVDDTYYRDRGYCRDIDVGFYCVWGHNPARPAFEAWLADWCRRKGYVFWGLKGQNVGVEYAHLLARTKVVVHLNRTAGTRPPRIFDCAASGAALLSNPMPAVSGEHFEPWVHYGVFDRPVDEYREGAERVPEFTDADCGEVIDGLEIMLDRGGWEPIAAAAKTYVLACHTWARRAVELRGIMADLFPKVGAE